MSGSDGIVVGYEAGADEETVGAKLEEKVASASSKRVLGEQDAESFDVQGESDRQAAEEAEGIPGVAYAEPNYTYALMATPDDPRFSGDGADGGQWGLRRSNAEAAWDVEKGRWYAGPEIAVLDSGYDHGHPDLDDKVVSERDCASDDPVAEPVVAHGTHVAGIAGAETDNGRGIAGAAWGAQLFVGGVVKASTGAPTVDAAVQCGNVAMRRGVKVISMSFGGYGRSETFRRAVEDWTAAGINVVASAGNCNAQCSGPLYPAAYEGVVGVGATDRLDGRWESSESSGSAVGDWVDVAAPGADVVSTVPGAGYGRQSGTSMAAPHVAAALELARAHGKGRLGAERGLFAAATDLGPVGKDPKFGHGALDMAGTLRSP